jgi:DNA-binding CsgD family transcriptional regulator
VLLDIEQEKLVVEVLQTSSEVSTLDELGNQVLPLIERTFDTSGSVLYRYNEKGQSMPLAGSLYSPSFQYVEEYHSKDPMQSVVRRLNPWILYASRTPEWKAYLQSPTYNEFCRPMGIHYFAHIRLCDSGHNDPGMVGLLLARSNNQSDFNETDGFILARLLPILESIVRRSNHFEKQSRAQAILEAMLDLNTSSMIALDLSGTLLWANEGAEKLLKPRQGAKLTVPDALVQGARRLRGLLGKNLPTMTPLSSIVLTREGKADIYAELRLARSRTGGPFVLVYLEAPSQLPQLKELALKFQLTDAETEILALLSLGLSDRKIARRRFVSLTTVHTHMRRILSKLGVYSRVQAALMARGLRPEMDSGEDD